MLVYTVLLIALTAGFAWLVDLAMLAMAARRRRGPWQPNDQQAPRG